LKGKGETQEKGGKKRKKHLGARMQKRTGEKAWGRKGQEIRGILPRKKKGGGPGGGGERKNK